MTLLYFVRHGESEANVLHVFSNRELVHGLTDTGRAQVQALADQLAGVRFDAFYTSPILRARQSAQIVSDRLGLPFEVTPALAEYDVGILEGRWKARVLSEHGGLCTLDAGAARGVFAGERLDVWRPGIEILDEDLARLGEDVWVGSVVITTIQGRVRARARLADGEVRPGDVLRPCSQATAPSISLRRQ